MNVETEPKKILDTGRPRDILIEVEGLHTIDSYHVYGYFELLLVYFFFSC